MIENMDKLQTIDDYIKANYTEKSRPSIQSVRRWIRQGKLIAIKQGRHYYIPQGAQYTDCL